MKLKLNLSKKNILTTFAFIGAFLLLSSSFVQPVSVQASKILINNVESKNTDHPLKTLLTDTELIKWVNKINLKINNNDNGYIGELMGLAKHVINRDDFIELLNTLECDYNTQNSRIQPKVTPNTRDVLDAFNSNTKLFFDGNIDFEIEIYEERARPRILTNIFQNILQNNVILKQLITNLLSRLSNKHTFDQDMEATAEPTPIKITFNLLHRNILYPNNCPTVLEDMEIPTITSFYLWLDMFFEVNYETESEDREDLITYFCNTMIGFNEFINDDELFDKYISVLLEDEELKATSLDILDNFEDKEYVKQKANETIEKLLNNPTFLELIETIHRKWNLGDLAQIIITLIIVLFFHFFIPLFYFSGLDLLIYIGLIGPLILGIMIPYEFVYLIVTNILLRLGYDMPKIFTKIAIVLGAIIVTGLFLVAYTLL